MKILQKATDSYFDSTNGKTPSCFSSNEYETWLKYEELANTKPRKFPCRDCTPVYQAEMRTVGKCHIPLIPLTKLAK